MHPLPHVPTVKNSLDGLGAIFILHFIKIKQFHKIGQVFENEYIFKYLHRNKSAVS